MMWLKNTFSADLRALAAFRIGLALVVLGDLYGRLPDLREFYTDAGIIPRDLALKHMLGDWLPSLHYSGGSMGYVVFLLLVQVFVTVLFGIGFKTGITGFLTWFFVCSMQARNLLVLHGGDALLRLMLFWAMFAPTGLCWAADYGFKTVRGRVFSLGTVAVPVQLLVMYFMTVYYKTGEAWQNGLAICQSISNPELATGFGLWLSQFSGVCRVLTWAVLVTQYVAPLLLLSPLRFWPLRYVGFAAIAGMHLGIAATLHMGNFSYVPIVAALVVLPWPGPEFDVRLNPLRWRIANAYGALCLVFVLVYNVRGVSHQGRYESWYLAFRNVNGLGQKWSMFSPNPPTEAQAFKATGYAADGSRVDLLRPSQPDWGRSWRWRKYWSNIRTKQYAWARPAYARFLQRDYQAITDREIQGVELYLMRRRLAEAHSRKYSLGEFGAKLKL